MPMSKITFSAKRMITGMVLVAAIFALTALGAQTAVAADTLSMFRLYNPNSGEHLYTLDNNEYSILGGIGWDQEGYAWHVPASGTDVYRLYNPNSGDHHYTADRNEYDTLAGIGWTQEDVAFKSASAEGGIPVYRLFNPNVTIGTHHYTTNQNEYNTLGGIGWQQEGIAFYGVEDTTVNDLGDFLIWLNKSSVDPATGQSQSGAALGYMAFAMGNGWGAVPSNNIQQYTNLNDPNDATSLANVKIALDLIDQLNVLRRQDGLNELEVSLFGMVESAYFANWSAKTNTIGHAAQNGYSNMWGFTSWGENAAWGYTHQIGSSRNFFSGWYWQEKANATGQTQTDSYGNTYTPEVAGQTGHYYNIINPNWQYTGMAYGVGGDYGAVAVNDFAGDNRAAGRDTYDATFTTDELRALIAQAEAEGVPSYEFSGSSIVYLEH